MMKLNRNWYRAAAIVVAVAVLIASSWPRLTLAPLGWSIEDKLMHALVYTLLAYFAVRGWVASSRTRRLRALFAIAGILTVFAGIDELHQHWIPGRFVELGDFLANWFGIFLGCLIASLQDSRK